MTKKEAWRRLRSIAWAVILGGTLGVLGSRAIAATWELAHDRIEVPTHYVLTQNQAALFAAALTAAVGLLGSWATKSREIRNARADQVAEAALDYHRTLWAILQATRKSHSQLDSRDTRLARLSERMEEIQSRPMASSPLLLPGVSLNDLQRMSSDIDAAKKEFDSLVGDPTWVEIKDRLDERSLAFTRLVMHSQFQILLFARRATRAIAAFDTHPTEDEYAHKADDALVDFLLESRATVRSMRQWWPRRWARSAAVTLKICRDDAREILKAITTSD